jgi:hypothetical protein
MLQGFCWTMKNENEFQEIELWIQKEVERRLAELEKAWHKKEEINMGAKPSEPCPTKH